MKTWLTCSLVILVIGLVVWQKAGPVVKAAQASPAVKMISPGQQPIGHPGEKGATYYAIEAQTTRLTMTFRDGHVAVADRGLVGGVRATIRDRGGNERGRLSVNGLDDAHDLLHFEPAGGTPFQAVSDPLVVKPTLDWVSRQAYALTKDGSANLVWDQGVMRPRDRARRIVESDVDEVETVWANGLVATMTRQVYPRRELAPGRAVQGPALVTELKQHGAPVGRAVWFERDRVFAYSLPGLVPGMVVIGEQELKNDYGGWPFTPDTTWLNLQLIAAHHFKTLVAKQGFVAKACEPAKPSRLAQFFMPTLYANDVGCDGLHYLDGTMFRGCCDDHDRCYSRGGCTSRSWWQVWTSWTCDVCNMYAFACFVAVGNLDDRCLMRQGCTG
ncbi:MAG: hypothetical protein JWL71_3573 [Acidobacteria bacterium]|nr:hypothetical protein [Acidobacteriota bacterium]